MKEAFLDLYKSLGCSGRLAILCLYTNAANDERSVGRVRRIVIPHPLTATVGHRAFTFLGPSVPARVTTNSAS